MYKKATRGWVLEELGVGVGHIGRGFMLQGLGWAATYKVPSHLCLRSHSMEQEGAILGEPQAWSLSLRFTAPACYPHTKWGQGLCAREGTGSKEQTCRRHPSQSRAESSWREVLSLSLQSQEILGQQSVSP